MTRTPRPARLLALLLAALCALLVGCSSDSGDPEPGSDAELVGLIEQADLAPCPPGLGPALPDLTVPCLGGGPEVVLQSATTGLPTVLNVWGSWCGPCREEVPYFQAFYTKAKGKVAVVGIDTKDKARAALSFAAFIEMTYPSVIDNDQGSLSSTFGVGTPKTAFLDADGKVQHVEFGQIPSLQALEDLVAEHLGVTIT